MLAIAHEYLIPGRVETFLALGAPLVIGRREGYRIWDIDGHELMDFHLNGGTYSLGHRHPAIVQALAEALQTLDIGNHHFPSEARAELAAQLAACTPGDLHYTVFTSGGSEAVDVAIKSARRYTGRRRIVAMESGYHGHTGLAGAGRRRQCALFRERLSGRVRESAVLATTPVPGDYDGDGNTDYAVWGAGNGYWYIIRSSDQGVTYQQWGTSGDEPLSQ